MKFLNDSIDFKTIPNGSIITTRENSSDYNGYGHISTFLRISLGDKNLSINLTTKETDFTFVALLLRGGFIFIQLGSIPIENVYLILLQNIVDIAISIASFGLIGNCLAFGEDSFYGLFSYNTWLTSHNTDYDLIAVGFSANLIGSAIITTLLSGRLHFLGYLLCSFLFSSLMQPLIMHWIWHENGWLHDAIFLKYKMCLKDHGGALVIHSVASSVGFMGLLFLGRRLLKLSEIDESSLGSESPGTTMIGYIFIILGLICFTIPQPSYEHLHYPFNYVGLIIINNLLALSAGTIVSILLNFIFARNTFNYWIILSCIQGGIAGIVMIAAGVDVYNPYIAFGIGALGGALFYVFMNLLKESSIEDYCNIIAIHSTCAFFGALLPSFLGTKENLGLSVSAHYKFLHFIWQLFGSLIALTTVASISAILFGLLYVTGFLRNSIEKNNHRRSVNASKIERSCCLQRLFIPNINTPFVEPGSSGKSPEIPLSARKSQDFQRMKENISSSKKSSPRETTKPERRVSYADNIEEGRNTKLIYTLHEIIHDAPPPVLIDSLKCSGDCAMFKNKSAILYKAFQKPERKLETICEEVTSSADTSELDNTESKHEKSKPKFLVDKRRSYYVLHKTRNSINLNRTRRRYVKAAPKEEIKVIERSEKLIEYDKQFNDDIITYKMPTNRKIRSKRSKNKNKFLYKRNTMENYSNSTNIV